MAVLQTDIAGASDNSSNNLGVSLLSTGIDRQIIILAFTNKTNSMVLNCECNGVSAMFINRIIGNSFNIEAWHCNSPDLGNVVVNSRWSAGMNQVGLVGYHLTGVNNTAPVTGLVGSHGSGGLLGSFVSSDTDNLVIDGVATLFPTISDPGQIVRFSENPGVFYQTSTADGAPTVAMGWIQAPSADFTHLAFNVMSSSAMGPIDRDSNASQIERDTRSYSFLFDSLVSGVAQGSYLMGVFVPENSVIVLGSANVKRSFSSGGASLISVGWSGDLANLIDNEPFSNFLSDGVVEGVNLTSNMVNTTDESRELIITISNDDLTDGALVYTCWVQQLS